MPITAAYVTRTSLSLSNLSLAARPFSIAKNTLDPGVVLWRRQWATSPFVNGALEVNSAQDVSHGSFTVYVRGASESDIQSNVALLIAAMSQRTYEVHLTIDGVDWGWTMFRADYSVVFDRKHTNRVMAECKFSTFRKPIPVAGPY